MSPSQKLTARDFEEAAISYEADAQKHLPTAQSGSPFLEDMSMAASARLAVLAEQPGNQNALRSIYRFAKLHTFTPPSLSRVMSPVLDHYRQRVNADDQDAGAYLMLAIATNILKGCKSYPGAAYVRKAAEVAPDGPAVCVEMAVCLIKTKSMWNPSTWRNKTEALDWLKKAVSLDPNNADAYSEWALLMPPSEKQGGETLVQAAENDPTNPFAVQYAKLHGDASRIDALVKAARFRVEARVKAQMEENAKEERARFLQGIESSVCEALADLAITEEDHLRARISETASGSLPIIEGDLASLLQSLMNCFERDTEGEPGVFFTVSKDSDGWGRGYRTHNVFVQCGRGLHHVGHYADQKYLGVLHARF